MINEALQAKFTMFDALGIFQHHDAITGTGMQRIADYYSKMLGDAVEKNNHVLSKIMEKTLGTETKVCDMQGLNLANCRANFDINTELHINVYNPSTLNKNFLRVKVPIGSYEVSRNHQSGQKRVES